MAKGRLTLLLFSLVIFSIFTTDAKVWSQDSGTMTIRVLMVYQTTNGFDRVPARIWNVTTNGVEKSPVATVDGHLELTIPRDGRSVFTLTPVYGHDDWLPLTITFTSPQEWILTFDSPGLDPIYREIKLSQAPDGTYYFSWRYREVGFFQPQDNPTAPIMGLFRDLDVDNAPARLPEHWGKTQYWNGDTYGTVFTYASPGDLPVSLHVTWTYPDGTYLVRVYPREGSLETEDGILAETDTGKRDHTYGSFPFRINRTYTDLFVQSLAPGLYFLSYRLVNTSGDSSNPMKHNLFIEAPEDWYPQ